MKVFKEKKCKICDEMFNPVAPSNLYCEKCVPLAIEVAKEKERVKAKLAYRSKQLELGRVVTHGKGSANKRGSDSPFYKNGIGLFHKTLKRQVKKELRYCTECGLDLVDADQYSWCVHHIDGDRTNNVRDNLTLLCKRCHQLHHKCWKAFEKGAETISKESTPKQVEAHSSYEQLGKCPLCKHGMRFPGCRCTDCNN